ncbi:MAG: UDP-N-acetylmuramate--L-alanine ligase [Sedimentisphaerales bacterium]|nr:UDP-N-acetylmuramate--L-alanine ligase [Sedimentisphaerales bacterium]
MHRKDAMNRSQTCSLDFTTRQDSTIALRSNRTNSIFNGAQTTAVLNKPAIDGCLTAESIGQNKIMIAGKRFHLIGAGGIGMSGLAVILLKNHALVAGSDQTPTQVTDHLCKLGADIKIGHEAENLDPGTDAVVISAAITEKNPELQQARRQGCIIYKYAEMLGELMDFYDGIAVAGTHGKSTTSGWLTYLLKQAGIDTNFVIGAEISQLGSSSGVGDSNFFVAEACEYDRSFLNLKPKIACILNIEQDHLDYYKDEAEIVDAFEHFAHGIKPGGMVIANGQDKNVLNIIRRFDNNIIFNTFGLDKSCDFYADNISSENGLYAFDIYEKGQFLGRTKISLPGKHNIYNALAVTAMAVNLGLEPKKIFELLPGFTGMDRRLMYKGQFGGITILDDYAHHPTEIRASLAAIRGRYNPKRLWCIFQPHQYSRTRFLLDDFTESFKLADLTIVPEIYFVRDSLSTKQEINAQILVERIKSAGSEALFIDGFGAICDYIKSNARTGDVIVTMGAGDIWKVADEYIQWLRRNS